MSAINADPEVMRWIGTGAVRTEEQTRHAIASWEHEWEHLGLGLFAVEELATQDVLGFTGLSVPSFLPEVMPAVEIGWRFGRPAWGHGYATEAARAVLSFAFDGVGLDRVVSIVQVGNAASERVCQRLGMRVVGEMLDPSAGRRVRVHELLTSDAGPARA